MKIIVEQVRFYEWNTPPEVDKLINENTTISDMQSLVEKYFNLFDAELISDNYFRISDLGSDYYKKKSE